MAAVQSQMNLRTAMLFTVDRPPHPIGGVSVADPPKFVSTVVQVANSISLTRFIHKNTSSRNVGTRARLTNTLLIQDKLKPVTLTHVQKGRHQTSRFRRQTTALFE